MQHDDQKSTAERLIKELQSTNEKLADTNKKLANECEKRKLENLALHDTVDALKNQCNELVVRQDEMEQFIENAFPPQPEGQSADNEEGEQETVDRTSSSNLDKRALSPDGSSGGAAKRSRCDRIPSIKAPIDTAERFIVFYLGFSFSFFATIQATAHWHDI
jgi:predicted RNase H-like nuclease (RuvC/YqgF family)